MTNFPQLDLPGDKTGPVFDAPWQAKAFALIAVLHARGEFAWSEWVDEFSAQRAMDEARPDDPGYYRSWVAAIEGLLARRGWTSQTEIETSIEETLADWPHPAHVAHREPIALDYARRGHSDGPPAEKP